MSTSDRGSASKTGRRRQAPREPAAAAKRMGGGQALPITVSREALLDAGSDRKFRGLINGLLTITTRMEQFRAHLGRILGVSGPQYSLLVTVGRLQETSGISVGQVAKALHVTSAFVANESNKLAKLGLLDKRQDPDDRRLVLLRLTDAGRKRLAELGPRIRAINDGVFATLDHNDFVALSGIVERIARDSRTVLRQLATIEHDEAEAGKGRS